jgi:hypothetical protein
METDPVNRSEEQFLCEGFRSYVEAMIAVKTFRTAVVEKCSSTLCVKLGRLGAATGTDLGRDSIWPSLFPKDASQANWTADKSWLAAGVTLSDLCFMCFGIVWRRNKANEGAAAVVAGALGFNSEISRAVLDRLHKLGANETESLFWVKHEASFIEPVSPEEAETFPERLDLLIDKWIHVWEQVGGLKGLLEV